MNHFTKSLVCKHPLTLSGQHVNTQINETVDENYSLKAVRGCQLGAKCKEFSFERKGSRRHLCYKNITIYNEQ